MGIFDQENALMEWQKILFKRGIKKKQKLKKILDLMPFIPERGIFIGCETGVIGSFVENRGGKWVHCDKEDNSLLSSKTILKGTLVKIDENSLPFKDKIFDGALIPDFLEHIENDFAFLKEVRRIIKEKGFILITVPHYKKNSILIRFKKLIGMKDEFYGHVRPGYKIEEIKKLVEDSGFEIDKLGFYSGSFTEIVEMALNIGFLLSGRKRESYKGSISPLNERDISSRKLLFKIHGIIYPFLQAFSTLDRLLLFQKGYVIYLRARKK
jgi:ubiquinone/menaquinone biosynthesis C-methylase UbiE